MAISKEFVLAGNATFTVETPDGHSTYRVKHKEAQGRYKDAWFIHLLTGPDNEASYTYLGVLDPGTGAVKLTTKSQYNADSYPVRLLGRILARVWVGDHQAYESKGYKTHHEGKCGRCGRKLTVPESIERGIGPECWGRGSGDQAPTAPTAPVGKDGALTYFISDRPDIDTRLLTAHRDAEGDVQYWHGSLGGKPVMVYNT